MPEARETVRGVPLDEPVYDDGGIMVQPIIDHPDGGVLVHNDEGDYIAVGEHHLKAGQEGEERFESSSLDVRPDGTAVVLSADNGSEIRVEDPEAVVNAAW